MNSSKKLLKDKEKNSFSDLQETKESLLQNEKALLKSLAPLGYTSIESFIESDPDSKLDQDELSEYIVLQQQCRKHLTEKEKVENIVVIDPVKINETVAAAEKVLVRNSQKHNIFQRSEKLVRCTKNRASSLDPNKLKQVSSYTIREIDQAFLTLFLNEVAVYVQFNKQEKEYRQVSCKEHIARYLLSKHEWAVPVLSGIINAPTLRSDGNILDKPGYDAQSGLLFLPGNSDFEKIPLNPDKEDVLRAKDKLLYILKEFPFENEVSRSVALAAILTALVRRSLATAPLFGFSAPMMSSGKTLLADVVSLIATGKSNSVISQSETETEEKKRLLGLLMEGEPIICYDNLEKPFGGPTICAILTQGEYKDRKLGGNETRTVPTHATFLVTGNNLVFVGDISTRTLLCKLDPQVEHPEERTFKIIDLRAFIIENRSRLVPAAITILRAYYISEDRPLNILPFGRFEQWSDLVRSAIIWLGLADPCESREEIANSDPVRLQLGSLFYCWNNLFGSKPLKAKGVIAVIDPDTREKYDANITEQLRDTLIELAGNTKGEVHTRKLSAKLRKYKNRIEKGYRLEQVGENQGTTLWSVKKIDT